MDALNAAVKFEVVALPFPEIIGDTLKLWAFPLYTHAPFPPTFLKSFCSDGPFECAGQI